MQDTGGAPPWEGASLDYRAMTRGERQALIDKHGLPPRPEGQAYWLLAPVLPPVIQRLQAGAVGWCNASSYGLACMLFVNLGHVFRPSSIGRWTLREWRRGKLQHDRAKPGWYFARSKRWTRNGTQLNRYEGEAERRERLWREKLAKQKARREARTRQYEERRERRRLARAQVTVAAPPLEKLVPMTLEETRAAVAMALAALEQPPDVAPMPAPRAPEPRRPTWGELVDGAELEELEQLLADVEHGRGPPE